MTTENPQKKTDEISEEKLDDVAGGGLAELQKDALQAKKIR